MACVGCTLSSRRMSRFLPALVTQQPPLPLLLLLLLLTVAVSGSESALQPLSEQEVTSCSLEELCAAAGRPPPPPSASSAELESRLAEVTARLDRLQRRLDSQLGSPAPRLDSVDTPVRDCSDLPAGAASGVHLVRPDLGRAVPAFCELSPAGGGWTVLLRRADIRPRRDFYLGWHEYKWGFGELDAEFWWGLEHLWRLTSPLDRRYELRIDLEDFAGQRRYASYQGFRISSEGDGYRMSAENYTGDAGDSLSYHVGQRFSTKDRDHDSHGVKECANIFKGAWWYKSCFKSNLNGQYLSGETPPKSYGVVWDAWLGINYSLKLAEMKIRPSKKL